MDMALQHFEKKELDLATETLHRSIDSGRRLFEAGDRLLADLEHLWRQTIRSESWNDDARRNRYLLIGLVAGVCVAIAARMHRHA